MDSHNEHDTCPNYARRVRSIKGEIPAPEGPVPPPAPRAGQSQCRIGRTIEAEGKAAAALEGKAVERKPMGLGRGGDRI